MAFKISRRKERRKIWKLFVVLVKGDIHIWSSRSGNRAFKIQHNVSYSSVRRQHEKGENIIFFYSVPRNESGEQWTANLCENVCYNIIVCVYLCKFDSFFFWVEGNEMEKRRRRNERKNYENYDFIFPQICDFIIITTRMMVMTLFLLSATAYPMLLCDMTLAIAIYFLDT